VSFTIDTGPVGDAAAALAGMADQLGDPSEPLRTTADEVTRLAGGRTPRSTGRLAASVSVAVDGPLSARVRWGVGYAVYVNFGTRRMPARPFATDALAAAAPALETQAAQWADDILSGGI